MKTKGKMTNSIRWIAAGLAVVLAIVSVWSLWSGSTLEAQASSDTFPGVAEVRSEVLASQDNIYYILEIVDDHTSSELGYYISGSEPYACLWDDNTKQYQSWTQKLNACTTADERSKFMKTLKKQVEDAKKKISSIDWSGEDYTETGVTASTDGARTLSQLDYSTVYGYFDYVEKGKESVIDNYWQVTFQQVTDVSVDTVNKVYTATPYYQVEAKDNTEYTYQTLYNLAKDESTASTLVCLDDPTTTGYCTAAEAWTTVSTSNSITISSGDLVTTENTNEMGYESVTNSPSGYFDADFALLETSITDSNCCLYVASAVYAVDDSGKPNGNSSLVSNTTSKKTFNVGYEIPAQTIYFTGYPTNTDAFRKEVIGLDDTECDSFPIRVYVMTPSDLNTYQQSSKLGDLLDQCSMVYVNTTGSKDSSDATESKDLSDDTLESLKSWIVDDEIPCLFDTDGVFSYSNNAYQTAGCGTNVGKLAAYLLASDKTASYDSLSAYLGSTAGKTDMAVDTDHDCNFVRDNVWFFSSSEHNHNFVRASLKDSNYDSELTKTGADFGQVLAEIKLENQYRDADSGYTSTDRLSEEVYDSTIWAYLINYSSSRALIDKTSLNILEIEPATNADASFTNNSKQLIQKLTGVSMDNIKVTQMSMNEFIGHIEDLNATYDMIYIGASTEGLNVDSNGLANYNDNNMYGLLYSHVGDLVTAQMNLSGLLTKNAVWESSWQYGANKENARYSGNDLTLDKYNALVEYLNASYPVLVDTELVSSGEVNADRVDNSSYLYEFLQKALDTSKYTNSFVWDAEKGLTDSSQESTFDFYANYPKLSLVADTEYPNYILATSMYNENVSQISEGSDGHYYLTYRFKIENKGAADYTTNYTCRLYLDVNADGKFSESNEELTGVTITDADGGAVSSDALRTDEWYTVSRAVPDGYSGCLTWSLEVCQNTNSGVRAAYTGYTKLDGLPATEIKILQVYYNSSSINLEKLIGTWNGSSYVSSYSNISGNYFYQYADRAKEDYILDITTISKTQFETGITGGTITLDDYDMLILGFSDASMGVDWDEAVVKGGTNTIQGFIESGKSVLFAHDMTSITNVKIDSSNKITYTDGSTSYNWNYRMNTYIRDLVGMDTYGITVSNLDSSSPYAVLRNNTALTLSDGTYSGISAPSKSGDYYVLGSKDVAFTPKSGRATTVAQVQGFTAATLNQYADRSTYTLTYRSGMAAGSTSSNGPYLTKIATRINEGQITNYPYVITNEDISIGSTHAQYYTLDLDSDADSDGESDLVVWYTLADGEFDKDYRDVKNNYYLYSKGNVIYTGMGHSADGLKSNYSNIGSVVTSSEAQLFINTMVAAYNSGVRKPDIVVSDESGVETNTIYHYFDDLTDTGAEAVNVYFTIDDQNITLGSKTETVRFYAEDTTNGSDELLYDMSDVDSGYIAEGIKLVDITDRLTVYVAATGAQVADLTQLSPDVQYYVTVPSTYFKDANGYATDLYITARTTITPTGDSSEPTYTPWAGAQVQYVKVELFDLD